MSQARFWIRYGWFHIAAGAFGFGFAVLLLATDWVGVALPVVMLVAAAISLYQGWRTLASRRR